MIHLLVTRDVTSRTSTPDRPPVRNGKAPYWTRVAGMAFAGLRINTLARVTKLPSLRWSAREIKRSNGWQLLSPSDATASMSVVGPKRTYRSCPHSRRYRRHGGHCSRPESRSGRRMSIRTSPAPLLLARGRARWAFCATRSAGHLRRQAAARLPHIRRADRSPSQANPAREGDDDDDRAGARCGRPASMPNAVAAGYMQSCPHGGRVDVLALSCTGSAGRASGRRRASARDRAPPYPTARLAGKMSILNHLPRSDRLGASHDQIRARRTCHCCGDAIFGAGDRSPRRRPGEELSRGMRQAAMPGVCGGVPTIARGVHRGVPVIVRDSAVATYQSLWQPGFSRGLNDLGERGNYAKVAANASASGTTS